MTSTERIEREVVKGTIAMASIWPQSISPGGDVTYCRDLHNASFKPDDDQVQEYRSAKPRSQRNSRQTLSQRAKESVHRYTQPLLKNNLRLAAIAFGADQPDYCYFLCTNLDAEDMPWDAAELDW